MNLAVPETAPVILLPTPKALEVCLGSRPLPWLRSLPDDSLAWDIQASAVHSGPGVGFIALCHLCVKAWPDS